MKGVAPQIRLGNIASNRDPRRAPWGYYCSDDQVFGVGLFLWFKTKEELLRFLGEYEGSNSEQHDQTDLRAGLRKVTKQIGAGRLGLEKGRQHLNELLKGYIQIEWLGTFDEMLAGKHLFCQQLRADFLEVEDSALPAPRIPERSVKGFVDFLRNYGH